MTSSVAIYVAGVLTLPACAVVIAVAWNLWVRAKVWWRRRHAQVAYSIRCDQCGRMFTFWSKRLARAQFDEHSCELREFVPTSELIPGKPPVRVDNKGADEHD